MPNRRPYRRIPGHTPLKSLTEGTPLQVIKRLFWIAVLGGLFIYSHCAGAQSRLTIGNQNGHLDRRFNTADTDEIIRSHMGGMYHYKYQYTMRLPDSSRYWKVLTAAHDKASQIWHAKGWKGPWTLAHQGTLPGDPMVFRDRDTGYALFDDGGASAQDPHGYTDTIGPPLLRQWNLCAVSHYRLNVTRDGGSTWDMTAAMTDIRNIRNPQAIPPHLYNPYNFYNEKGSFEVRSKKYLFNFRVFEIAPIDGKVFVYGDSGIDYGTPFGMVTSDHGRSWHVLELPARLVNETLHIVLIEKKGAGYLMRLKYYNDVRTLSSTDGIVWKPM